MSFSGVPDGNVRAGPSSDHASAWQSCGPVLRLFGRCAQTCSSCTHRSRPPRKQSGCTHPELQRTCCELQKNSLEKASLGTVSVVLVCLSGASPLDRAIAAEVFTRASSQRVGFELREYGLEGDDRTVLDGVALERGAICLVLASPDAAGRDIDAEVLLADWLLRSVRPDVTLCAIGGGVEFLAGRGLLDARRATAHQSSLAGLQRRFPGTRWETSLFCQDGNVVTCPGALATVDLALHLVRRLCGRERAVEVSEQMLLYIHRTNEFSQTSPWLQRSAHLHPAVQRVQELLSRDPTKDWSPVELAARVGISERHLQRLFGHQVGSGVLEYMHRLRLSRAKEILASRHCVSLERVAEAAGFSSSQHLRRTWRKLEGETPSAFRGRATQVLREIASTTLLDDAPA
jgi:transcriptional regulator GlxA family with amidase domain